MIAFVLMPLLACHTGTDLAGPSNSDAQASVPQANEAAPTPATATAGPAVTPTATTPSSLPDLTKDLLKGGCADGPGNEGADSYFWGSFTLDGDKVTGQEHWVLFANAKWEKKGGSDCAILWNVEGTVVPPLGCSECQTGLHLRATPNVTNSNCPEGLVKKEAKSQELRYDLRKDSDGTSHIFFAKSGKRLGQGYHDGDAFNYISDHACRWF